MQGEHWIIIANSYREIFQGCEKYNLFQQNQKQIMPQQFQSIFSNCGFYAINAVFLLFQLRQQMTRIHDVLNFF